MAKSTLIHPHFVHTLDNGFHTHLTIPIDFFSKYVEGKSLEKTAAELKSDTSDMSWKVKMTCPRLTTGWEEFAVANNFQIGEVVLVRYEGDMVFHVSDLGPSCCEIRDLPPPRNNNVGENDIGKNLLKKCLHPRTQVDFLSNDGGDGGDDDDYNIEHPRKKKVKKNSPEAEAVSSTSPDNLCFVAVVTASSLRTDKLYLPQHFTSSNGITRKCRKAVFLGGGVNSWAFDLRFNKSSNTFYISRGWRSFCDENGQEAGGFFMFKLVGNGETLVLSYCPTETINDRRQRDCSGASGRESLSAELSSEEENIEGESNDSSVNLSTGDECSSMDSSVNLSSEDRCSSVKSMMKTEKKKYSPKGRVKSYSSYSPCQKQSVTFTLPPDYDRIRYLTLPSLFLRENGINKPGEIYLLGKDGIKWPINLLLDNKGAMRLGRGWRDFAKSNGVETGFTLKLMWEDTTPVFSLCYAESTSDREQEEFSNAIKKPSLFINPSNSEKIGKVETNKEEGEKTYLRGRTPSSQKQFVTLTIKPYSVTQCKLVLPKKFTRENDITKPGMITLLGSDGIKQQTKLLFDKGNGFMYLGKGWKDFAKANGFNTGDSFTLKLIWENTIPVLSLCPAERSIDRGGEEGEQVNGEPISCKKIIKEESRSTEKEKNHPRERDSTPIVRLFPTESSVSKATESVSTEPNRRDSSSSIRNRFVTLTLTLEDVKACKLHLPNQFMRDNGINKLGKMTILGENKMELSAYLLSRDGTVALENGWDEFCEANGVKLGEFFTLEFIIEQDNTTPLLKFCSWETNDYKNKC